MVSRLKFNFYMMSPTYEKDGTLFAFTIKTLLHYDQLGLHHILRVFHRPLAGYVNQAHVHLKLKFNP